MRQKKETFGIKEAARKLHYSLKHVYDLVQLGKLPAKKIRRQWCIPAEAVEARLKERGW